MLKVFILVSGKTFFFLPSFASLNNANFSSERVLSCSASENKHEVMRSWFFLLVYENSFPSVIRYNERKNSRNEERPVVTRRKQYHETNKRHDLKTWNLRHEDSRQKQFSKRRSVCGSMKSKYRFCPRSDVISRVSSITSRCSANEPALGRERAAEMEPRYVWTAPQ